VRVDDEPQHLQHGKWAAVDQRRGSLSGKGRALPRGFCGGAGHTLAAAPAFLRHPDTLPQRDPRHRPARPAASATWKSSAPARCRPSSQISGFLMQINVELRAWTALLARHGRLCPRASHQMAPAAKSAVAWEPISTAPFDCELELAVMGDDGPHALAFPCRRILGGWINAETKERIVIVPGVLCVLSFEP
jgi:hypothetical protein